MLFRFSFFCFLIYFFNSFRINPEKDLVEIAFSSTQAGKSSDNFCDCIPVILNQIPEVGSSFAYIHGCLFFRHIPHLSFGYQSNENSGSQWISTESSSNNLAALARALSTDCCVLFSGLRGIGKSRIIEEIGTQMNCSGECSSENIIRSPRHLRAYSRISLLSVLTCIWSIPILAFFFFGGLG